LASVLLLMALIGAIVLARREFVVPQAQEGDLSLLERARPQLESESERPAELVSTR